MLHCFIWAASSCNQCSLRLRACWAGCTFHQYHLLSVRCGPQASIIVFLLAVVIGTGVTLTAAFGGRFAIQDLIHRHNIAFSSLCT
jgi:hypothetical protein